MKKILIVTWYYSINFGTALQAFALQKYLSNEGYFVELLNYFNTKNSWNTIIKRIVGKLNLIQLIRYYRYRKYSRLRSYIKHEIKEHYVFSNSDLKKIKHDTHAFITGSDQIWNTYYSYNSFYFLGFVSNVKKIAYASSVGTNSIRQEVKNEVGKLLNDFNKIGVRENSTVEMLSEVTGRRDIVQVVDPTFLLDSNDWMTIAKDARFDVKLPKNYICCYFIGNNSEYVQQLKNVSLLTGIKDLVIIPSVENPNFEIEDGLYINYAGPKEFVKLLQHAKYICTDSFHTVALSINFSKDFVVFKRFKDTEKVSQNSRLYDLLGQYELIYKLYSDSKEWYKSVDYEKVQTILNSERNRSKKFLLTAIEENS